MTIEPDVKHLTRVFHEVRTVRGFEDVALQIQQAIIDGRLKAGDRLPNERELGSVFGVSRPTLREAIRRLEAAGIVEVKRGINGGTFITEPNPNQVGQALAALIRFRGATADELAEFRANFEAETAYWAAKRATGDQISRLLEIAHQFSEISSLSETPWSKIVDLDIAFHEEVAYASQNQIRVAIMLAVHDVLQRASLRIGEVEDLEWRQQQAEDLSAIAQAIGHRRTAQAKRLMRQHVELNLRIRGRESDL